MRLHMTKVIPERQLEFAVQGMGRGAFEAQAAADVVSFVAELDIGSDVPLIGSLFDFIFRRFFRQKIHDD